MPMYKAKITLTDNPCKSFYKRWLERGNRAKLYVSGCF